MAATWSGPTRRLVGDLLTIGGIVAVATVVIVGSVLLVLLGGYLVFAVPFLAFVGVLGALVALVRGRPRVALAFAIVGVSAIAIVILTFYSAA